MCQSRLHLLLLLLLLLFFVVVAVILRIISISWPLLLMCTCRFRHPTLLLRCVVDQFFIYVIKIAWFDLSKLRKTSNSVTQCFQISYECSVTPFLPVQTGNSPPHTYTRTRTFIMNIVQYASMQAVPFQRRSS